MALAGLAACAVSHEGFYYEVTERSATVTRVQTHKAILNLSPEELHNAYMHMHQMATGVCNEFGRDKAVYQGERQYTTGAYYAWVERSYKCT